MDTQITVSAEDAGDPEAPHNESWSRGPLNVSFGPDHAGVMCVWIRNAHHAAHQVVFPADSGEWVAAATCAAVQGARRAEEAAA